MGSLADVIKRAKFYLNRDRGFDTLESNFWLSHRNITKSPLTQGLNYTVQPVTVIGYPTIFRQPKIQRGHCRLPPVTMPQTVCVGILISVVVYMPPSGLAHAAATAGLLARGD